MSKTMKALVAGASAAALMLTLVPAAQAQAVMFVKNNRVGVGVDNPTQLVHVRSSSGVARILVEEAAAGFGERVLFNLRNNGPTRFTISNSGSGGGSWSFKTSGAGMRFFDLSKDATGVAEARIDSITGNMRISGTSYLTGSSRALKENFEPVDGVEILERLVAMPMSSWSAKLDPDGQRHIGPIAEEWWATFGLGPGDKSVSLTDVGGVALAAIQGLNQELELRDEKIARLETELDELRQLILSRTAD